VRGAAGLQSISWSRSPHLRRGAGHFAFDIRNACLLLTLLAGCAVGPNFERPAPPDVTGFIATGLPVNAVEGLDIPGEWWTLFHSQPLNDLIARSFEANPNLKAAQAALAVARANVLAQRGAYFPSVDANGSASRSKTSQDLSPVTNTSDLYFELYTGQLLVSFTPDVFGLNRRTVESLQAQAEQQRFALAATYITLSSNVAAAAIQEASLRAQIAATHEIIMINSKMLEVLRTQFAKGYANRLDVAAQESQLAQVEASLPPLLKQLGQARDQLAVLSGQFPSEELVEEFELSSLQLPEDLPMSVPAKLVEQRPDVRQAEENLHSASALVGVAVANRLPNITLTADLGTAAVTTAALFGAGTEFWTLAASVTQPIFHGGALYYRERAARAALEQSLQQYRSAVLIAFQNVADTLHALREDANAVKAATAAKDAASVTLELAQKQFQSGYANYLSLLSAEQTYRQALINLVQAQANRYLDTAALFQALGGGWWNSAYLR